MSIYLHNDNYMQQDHITHACPIIGWHSVLDVNDIAADSSLDGRPALNMWNPDTASVWESGGTSEQYITLANTGGGWIDYVGIAKHNFGSGGVQFQLQAMGSGGWEDITDVIATARNAAIIIYFNPRTSSAVRLRLIPQGVAPVIAHIKLGSALVLQRRIYVGHKPATLTRHASVITNGSENGQFLGKIVTREWHQTDVKQANVTPDFMRSQIVPFIKHAQTGTFFFAWRPLEYPDEVVYGWTDDNIEPVNQRVNGMMEFGFSVQAVA